MGPAGGVAEGSDRILLCHHKDRKSFLTAHLLEAKCIYPWIKHFKTRSDKHDPAVPSFVQSFITSLRCFFFSQPATLLK